VGIPIKKIPLKIGASDQEISEFQQRVEQSNAEDLDISLSLYWIDSQYNLGLLKLYNECPKSAVVADLAMKTVIHEAL